MFKRTLPEGFVVLSRAVPSLVIDLKYTGSDNFVGRPIAGYAEDGDAIVTQECAQALAKIQETLQDPHFKAAFKVKEPKLVILEAFRPLMAGDDFWAWGQSDCQKTKQAYYPRIAKQDFFALGYLARRSSHSRGSTVDVTIIDTANNQTVDFGTPFDFMDELSHPDNQAVSKTAYENRQHLKNLMAEFGFEGIPQEWWHFTLKNEPFPDTYFNFEVAKYES
ncbi:M15 family metallopeptidase [Candidatus Berkiella aquae]|uniref:D-alanyl-D-alanine dipeptidase n=1 Tax=Candidatus Berkiella aquae TaxID=295108 RepID=A0A0Q9YKF0_9GAMM|nr:M15 family metallopeptidase [Candidatus Berkiella aquae]MCS5711200.1 M15 family metallopeptidase [Candidatus Berkiella aquae]